MVLFCLVLPLAAQNLPPGYVNCTLHLTGTNTYVGPCGPVLGINGKDGKDGKDGKNGVDGKPGVSTTITVPAEAGTGTEIEIRHHVFSFHKPDGSTAGGFN